MTTTRNHSRVGVVLLNWNGGEYTIPCVESLLAGSVVPEWILVWDNASTDDSPERIGKRFPGVQIIRSENNIGFAAANNRGASELLRRGADHVWILNNDTLVAPDCLKVLMEAMEEHPEVAGTTGKILYAEPADAIWYAGARCRPWSLKADHRGVGERDVGQFDQAGPVEFISGCCMLIRREALESHGLFDERYFIYDEDTDWCLRMREAGRILWYEPRAVLWHRVSATMKKNTLGGAGGTVSAKQHYYYARNQLFTIRRHAKRPWQYISALACLLFNRVVISGGLVLFGKWGKLASLWRGVADGWRTPVDGVCSEIGVLK